MTLAGCATIVARPLHPARRPALTPAARWSVSAGLSYTRSRFKEADPLFLVTRGDDYYGLDAGVSYRLSKQLACAAIPAL